MVELCEDDGETESADPTLTASAFAEPSQTPEDFDAFAPEPQLIPKASSAEAETSKREHSDKQFDSGGTLCLFYMEPLTSTGNHRIWNVMNTGLIGQILRPALGKLRSLNLFLVNENQSKGQLPHELGGLSNMTHFTCLTKLKLKRINVLHYKCTGSDCRCCIWTANVI